MTLSSHLFLPSSFSYVRIMSYLDLLDHSAFCVLSSFSRAAVYGRGAKLILFWFFFMSSSSLSYLIFFAIPPVFCLVVWRCGRFLLFTTCSSSFSLLYAYWIAKATRKPVLFSIILHVSRRASLTVPISLPTLGDRSRMAGPPKGAQI